MKSTLEITGKSIYRGQLSLVSIAAAITILTGCENFNAAPVEFSQQDIVTVGDVETIELHGRVLSSLPVTLPEVDPDQAELGRLLFWDPILSGDKNIACGTCHLPEHGYTDGQSRSIGVGGVGRGVNRTVGHTGRVPRNAQSVLNTAWNGITGLGLFDPATAPMFWDSRESSLEKQAIQPIESLQEMRGESIATEGIHIEIERRLNNNSVYREAFATAFGIGTIAMKDVAQALSVFQRTLIANNSRFDQWMRGDATAMTARELSGMQEFVIAGCADCHSGPLFSDFTLHVLGLPEGTGLEAPDQGDGNFAFRTPGLRQLSLTAPYFHAGQFASLDDVIEFYDEPRKSQNPNVPSAMLDEELLEVPEMDGGRGNLIVDFLKTLDDDSFDRTIPSEVPSGLTPGGD